MRQTVSYSEKKLIAGHAAEVWGKERRPTRSLRMGSRRMVASGMVEEERTNG